jgi:N-acyl-D-aspartate/D-glutamate deacylase
VLFRSANREPVTEADIHAMAAIARRAMEAGAIGFATSRTLNHRTSDGQPTPTLTAGEDELTGIAMGMAAAGRGVLQVVSDFQDPEAEWAMLRRLVETSGRPLSFSLLQSPKAPRSYQFLLERLRAANLDGLQMRAQVASRPVGILFGLELTLNPFSQHAVYREIAGRPLAERVAALRDPSFRACLLGEEIEAQRSFAGSQPRNWAGMFLMGEDPDYERRRPAG